MYQSENKPRLEEPSPPTDYSEPVGTSRFTQVNDRTAEQLAVQTGGRLITEINLESNEVEYAVNVPVNGRIARASRGSWVGHVEGVGWVILSNAQFMNMIKES